MKNWLTQEKLMYFLLLVLFLNVNSFSTVDSVVEIEEVDVKSASAIPAFGNIYGGGVEQKAAVIESLDAKEVVSSIKEHTSKEPIKPSISWNEHTPWSTIEEFAKYHKKPALEWEERFGKPAELILAKAWQESHGGRLGKAGKAGNWFGIKNHKGNTYSIINQLDDKYPGEKRKSYDFVVYPTKWFMIKSFCEFIDKPLYKNRYKRWKKNTKQKEYELWALALQVDWTLAGSKKSYASCNCKDGRIKSCYKKRKESARKVIALCKRVESVIR